jgi:hypothetical protein
MANQMTLTREGIALTAAMVSDWKQYERCAYALLPFGHTTDGVWWSVSHREAARWLPFDHRHAFWGLGRLVERKVLLVRPGIGSRPSAYLVEGDVRRWDVSWGGKDREHVQLMLEDFGVVAIAPQEAASRRATHRCVVAPPGAAPRRRSALY